MQQCTLANTYRALVYLITGESCWEADLAAAVKSFLDATSSTEKCPGGGVAPADVCPPLGVREWLIQEQVRSWLVAIFCRVDPIRLIEVDSLMEQGKVSEIAPFLRSSARRRGSPGRDNGTPYSRPVFAGSVPDGLSNRHFESIHDAKGCSRSVQSGSLMDNFPREGGERARCRTAGAGFSVVALASPGEARSALLDPFRGSTGVERARC